MTTAMELPDDKPGCGCARPSAAHVSYRGVKNSRANGNSVSPLGINDSSDAPDQALAQELLPCADQFDIGVDRVRLHFEIDGLRTDGVSMARFRERRGANTTVVINGRKMPVHIGIRCQGGDLGGVRLWATVEFNPSGIVRAVAGLEQGLTPWSTVRRLCELVVQGIEGIAPPLCSVADISVVALHLARDIVVDDPAAWLQAAVGTRPAWAREQAQYVGDDGQIETLVSGSKSIRVVLYAKTAHALRWENQITTSKVVTRLRVGSIGALTPLALACATAHLWRRSRLAKVRKHPRLVDLLAPDGRGDARIRELFGWVAARAAGVQLDDGMSTRDIDQFRGRAAVAGIEVSPRRVRVTADPWRLDVVSGTEVPADPPA